MRNTRLSFVLFFSLIYTLQSLAQTTYTKVTSTSGLEVGANYLIVAHNDDLGVFAMGYQKANNRAAVVIDEMGDAITVTLGTDPASETDVFQFTLGGNAGAWTLFDEVKGGYLYAASSTSNNLKTQTELDANGQWSIIFNADGTAEVIAQGENTRNNLRFNPNIQNNSPMFSCYASSSNIDTRVSFYKECGSVQPVPEPTNYPSNFMATVNERDVTLTWNDVLGGQLPHKYLVIGSIGNITVPTDGTPLPDGNLVRNVNYGVQSVTFSNLNSNTTYHFAIFPYTNSGAYIDYKNNGNYPTANATTEDITVLLFENFNEELGVFTAHNIVGEQEWHHGTYQGTTYANMNSFANGVANANEDWLISPAINKTGFSDIFVEFNTAMKFEWMPLRVMFSTNYNGQSDPNDYDWQDITNLFNYSTGNYEWVESSRVSVSIPSNTFYFAFVYISNTTNAPSWEIDYVSIEALSNGVNDYTITVSANPTNGGTVTGGGTYQQGSSRTVTATANSSYSFTNWTENGSVVSTNASYTFTLNSNRNLVANFTAAPVSTYTITVSANPTNGGTVTGGGTYNQGSSRTVTATANSGYSFTNWTENGSVVSSNSSYTFTLNSNRNLVANFNPIAHEYTITANPDPAEGGTVMGAGTYEEGAICELTAIPNDGYGFENWTRNGNVISNENPYSFSVSRDITLVAHFRQDASHFTIIAKAEPIEGGSVSGGGTFELGETCHLNTIANDGYEFVNWTLNGIEVSTDPSCNFPVTGNATYVAHFRRAVNHYTITVSIEPTDAGSVLGAGPYEEEASCTLIAMSNPTYSFVGWMENGVVVYTESPYSFRVDRNRTLVAVFSQGLFYTISASAGPNGIISPSGDVRVMPGEDQTFTFIPDNGCSVSRVIVDGIDRGAEPSHTFRNVNEDHTIYVQFSGLGVDDHIAANLKIYPNPAQDKINIESPNMKHVAVFNLLGVQIESKDVNDDYAMISTNEFPQGTYILKVEYLDESVGYSRFVVAK